MLGPEPRMMNGSYPKRKTEERPQNKKSQRENKTEAEDGKGNANAPSELTRSQMRQKYVHTWVNANSNDKCVKCKFIEFFVFDYCPLPYSLRHRYINQDWSGFRPMINS